MFVPLLNLMLKCLHVSLEIYIIVAVDLLSLSACMRVTVVVVSVSVTALVATYLVYMSKLRWHRVSCRFLKDMHCVDFVEDVCSGDRVLFACHNDGSFPTTIKTPHQWFLTMA